MRRRLSVTLVALLGVLLGACQASHGGAWAAMPVPAVARRQLGREHRLRRAARVSRITRERPPILGRHPRPLFKRWRLDLVPARCRLTRRLADRRVPDDRPWSRWRGLGRLRPPGSAGRHAIPPGRPLDRSRGNLARACARLACLDRTRRAARPPDDPGRAARGLHDGETGAAIVQPLRPDGQPDGAYSALGNTTRELYTDSNALDAGFALAAIGRHVVALWHATDQRLEVSVSEDAGRSWRNLAPLSTQAAWDRPHLLVSGSRFVALIDWTAGSSSLNWLEFESSSDGGATWVHGPALSNGPWVRGGVVSQAGSTWTVAYAECLNSRACTIGPSIWYRGSGDGQHWTHAEPLTLPGDYFVVGVGTTAGRAWAIWQHDFTTYDEDRTLEGAIR